VRVLEVAMDHDDGAVLIAVQSEGGAVFQHPVELRGAVRGGTGTGIDLAAGDDGAAIERSARSGARQGGHSLAPTSATVVTAQRLVVSARRRRPRPLQGGDLVAAAADLRARTVRRHGSRRGPHHRAGDRHGPLRTVIAMRYVRRHLKALRGCLAPANRPAALGLLRRRDRDRRRRQGDLRVDHEDARCEGEELRARGPRADRLPGAKAGGALRFPFIVERSR
jgi:hypothetical protein